MNKNSRTENIIISWIIGILVLFLIVTPLLWLSNIEKFNWDLPIHYEAFGTFGDFWGGFIGTLVAILALWAVYKTYTQSQIQHKKQSAESTFFEILELHQTNVRRLEKIDPDIFERYASILKSLNSLVKRFKEENQKDWSILEIFKVSYLYFFYGTKGVKTMPLSLNDRITDQDIENLNLFFVNRNIDYAGSYLELGIYYRQLFQIIKYINECDFFSYKEKMSYIKIIRVRLNIYEQYFLFLNSMSTLGEPWEKGVNNKNDKLITKYNLLKNIPKEFPQLDGLDFRTEYDLIEYEYLGRWPNIPEREKWIKNYT